MQIRLSEYAAFTNLYFVTFEPEHGTVYFGCNAKQYLL